MYALFQLLTNTYKRSNSNRILLHIQLLFDYDCCCYCGCGRLCVIQYQLQHKLVFILLLKSNKLLWKRIQFIPLIYFYSMLNFKWVWNWRVDIDWWKPIFCSLSFQYIQTVWIQLRICIRCWNKLALPRWYFIDSLAMAKSLNLRMHKPLYMNKWICLHWMLYMFKTSQLPYKIIHCSNEH